MSPWESLKKWRKFFKKAGIPKDVATSYAIIFHQNDISFDVLYDIDKVRTYYHLEIYKRTVVRSLRILAPSNSGLKWKDSFHFCLLL